MHKTAKGRKCQQGQSTQDMYLVAPGDTLHQRRIRGKGYDPPDPGSNRVQNVKITKKYIVETGTDNKDQAAPE